MGWRFRRSLKIAPGLRLNIGKRGISSLSVGGRGARMTFGRQGVRQTVGLPGTGLSFSSNSRLGSSRANSRAVSAAADLPFVDPQRFGITAEPLPADVGKTRKPFFVVGVLVMGAAAALPVPDYLRLWVLLGGAVLFAVGFVRPSRDSLEAIEQRRIEDLARAELDRRKSTFAAAVAALPTRNLLPFDVKSVLAQQHELGLTDAEVGPLQIERLKGIEAVLDFEVSCRDRLIPIGGHEQVVAPDTCYFAARAVHDKRGDNDPSGTLYLTDARTLFVSTEGTATAAWRQVISVGLDSRTLRVQRRDRQNPYLFDLFTFADALKAEFIAKRALSVAAMPLPPDARPSEPAQARERATAPRSVPKHAIRVDHLEVDDEHHCDLGTGQGCTVAIVGESYRQTPLRELSAGRRERGDEVRFIAAVSPDPTNPYEANAVRIDILNGAQVGYLSRDDAAAYALALKAVATCGKKGVCRARLIGGTPDKPSIGVLLDLADPQVLIAKFSVGGQPF